MTTLTLSARLDRTDSSTPWGFRMQGGRDYGSQLVITRVTPGSLAAKCGLQVGDAITKIGDSPTDSLIHKEAQQQIIRGGNSLELALQRGGTGRATHHVAAPGASPAYSTPPPQPQQSAFRPVGGEQEACTEDPEGKADSSSSSSSDTDNDSYNAAPKPFAPGGSTVPVAVNKQYNTPIQMYSVNNVMDSLATQTVGMNVSSGGSEGSDSLPPAPHADDQMSNSTNSTSSLHESPSPPPPAPPPPITKPDLKPYINTKPRPFTKPSHLSSDSTSTPTSIKVEDNDLRPATLGTTIAGSLITGPPSTTIPGPPITGPPSTTIPGPLITGPPSTTIPGPPITGPPGTTKPAPSKPSQHPVRDAFYEDDDGPPVGGAQSRSFKLLQSLVDSGEDVSALKRVPSPKPPDNKPTLMTGRLTATGPTPSAPKPLDNKPILMTGRAAGPPQSAPPPIPSQPPPPMAPSGGGNRNNAAADFSETPSGKYVKAIVNNQYNTPMGLYSTTNKDDTFQTQAHGILSMIQGVDSDVMEQPNERKKIVIPSSTTAFKDSVQEPIERPKIVVSSVIRNDDTVQESTERKKIVVPSTTYKVSRSPSPYSSSEHLENNNSTKGDVDGVKSYVPSETYRLVQEEDASKDESPFSKTGPSKTQGRTFNILQKQLNEPSGPPRVAGTSPGGYKPSAPAAAPAPAPGKAPWKPQIPSGERSMRVGRVGEAKRVSQAAGRIPICNSCGVQIRGPFVSALEKTWCPDHFVCANPHCGVPLIDQGFVEEAGQLFCVRDYEQYFAPKCNKCGSAIIGDRIQASSNTYHPHCFVCCHCRQPITGNQFHTQEGEFYCAQGRVLTYEVVGGGGSISDDEQNTCKLRYVDLNVDEGLPSWIQEIVNALRQTYHTNCFLCSQCHQPIGSGSFHTEEGKTYCQKDWAALFQTKCYGCQFPIEPGDRWVEALNQNWHSECFNCSTCQCNLEGQSFFAKAGKPYCKKHAGGGQRM